MKKLHTYTHTQQKWEKKRHGEIHVGGDDDGLDDCAHNGDEGSDDGEVDDHVGNGGDGDEVDSIHDGEADAGIYHGW